jgi:exodeoxyribonuclease VII small subunit
MKTNDDPELAFETALEQIEQIVADLERGEPELATALAKYEQAVGLLAHCQRLLDRAEQTVALLTGVDDQGQPLTAPFDATATAATAPPPRPGRKPSPDSANLSSSLDNDDSGVPF